MEAEVAAAVINSAATIIVALIAALTANLVTRHYEERKTALEEHKTERELFMHFNERFDKLNEQLNAIHENSASLELTVAEQEAKVLDYLNLCSEEFLWVEKKLIKDPRIWAAWKQGILFYCADSERPNSLIAQVFHRELTSPKSAGSYYGLHAALGFQVRSA
jgi:hypothetical protein